MCKHNPHAAVQNYIAAEAEAKRSRSVKALQAVENAVQWEERRELVRRRLLDSLGGLPERTDGNPVVINIIEREDYTIENIRLESLPDIPINLNLFVPKNRKKPLPAVIFTTGHLSKTHRMHQYPVIGLVKKGYVVACFDCYGRGERTFGNEHFTVGPLSWLNGRCMNRYFIHDSMQVTDYLFRREDVDPGRIGCAGASGGGNTAIYHAALDERISCLVSVCTISSFTDLIQLQYSGCPEYYPIGLLGEEIDIQDIAALIAPRPYLLVGGAKDELNIIQSLKKTYQHIRNVYRLYGKTENVSYYVDEDGTHGCGRNMRKAMYDWFDRHFSPEYRNNYIEIQEENMEILEPEAVLDFLSGVKSNLISYEYETMKKGTADLNIFRLKSIVGLNKREISFRIADYVQSIKKNDYYIERYVIETEKNILVPIRILRLSNPDKMEGILLMVGKGKMAEHSILQRAIEEQRVIITAELRGTGSSSLKGTPWDRFGYCSADRAVSGGAIVLGYPLIGQKVYDLLAVLKFIEELYTVNAKVRIQSDMELADAVEIASLLYAEAGTIELCTKKVCLTTVFETAVRNKNAGIDVKDQVCMYESIIPGLIHIDR